MTLRKILFRIRAITARLRTPAPPLRAIRPRRAAGIPAGLEKFRPWSLNEIYAEHGARVLAEARQHPDVAADVQRIVDQILLDLEREPIPQPSGLAAYLMGWAMAAMETVTAPGAQAPRPGRYSYMVLVFAAVSRVALAAGLIAASSTADS